MKLDFFSLSRPELPKETKSFSDPRFKGDKSREITLTLRALDAVQIGEMQELASDKMMFYCGDPENGIEPKSMFPPLSDGGEPIKLNDTTAHQAAGLTVMQCPEKDEDRYEFEDFVVMAIVCRGAWRKILQWRSELNRKGELVAGE